MKIFRLFKKPKIDGIHWVLVDWCKQAKERSVGGNHLKKIIHMYGEYPFKVETYSEEKIKALKRMGVFVKDKTLGQEIPKDAWLIPPTYEILGRIQITKRIG